MKFIMVGTDLAFNVENINRRELKPVAIDTRTGEKKYQVEISFHDGQYYIEKVFTDRTAAAQHLIYLVTKLNEEV